MLYYIETESENWNFLKYGRIGKHPVQSLYTRYYRTLRYICHMPVLLEYYYPRKENYYNIIMKVKAISFVIISSNKPVVYNIYMNTNIYKSTITRIVQLSIVF